MRLVCPNCEAKYEVPEDAIPETGRDVQCANCGHAWYQMRPRAAAEGAVAPVVATSAPAAEVQAPPPVEPEPITAAEAPAEAVAAPDEPAPPEPEVAAAADVPEEVASPAVTEEVLEGAASALDDVIPEPVAEAVAETAAKVEDMAEAVEAALVREETVPGGNAEAPVEERAADIDGTRAGLSEADDDYATEAAAIGSAAAIAAAPAAYAVDDSVLAILREEAEREAQARRSEVAKPLEVQSDLGIDAAMPATRKPVEVISSDPAPADVAAEPADDRLAGRARLPDVEEINSTLRPSEQATNDEAPDMTPVVEGRSSFRSGFLLVMTLAILGVALYVSADALAGAVPALAGTLEGYVGFVDSLRLQLDGLMQSATVAINGGGT